MQKYPNLLGLGLSEDTAIVVTGDHFSRDRQMESGHSRQYSVCMSRGRSRTTSSPLLHGGHSLFRVIADANVVRAVGQVILRNKPDVGIEIGRVICRELQDLRCDQRTVLY